MRTGGYRDQCVPARIVMIESSSKPLAFVHCQIELERVAGASRRIRLDGVLNHRTADAKAEVAFPCRQDTCHAVKDPRKLGESDRALVIEGATRVTLMKDFFNPRDCLRMRDGELVQHDLLYWPSWPHRRERSHDTRIGIKPTQWVGVPTFRAARVEQKIVKVPKNQVVVTLGQSGTPLGSGLCLEKDLAINQQSEKFDPRKAVVPTKPSDLLGRGQCGDRGRDLWIANSKQCAGARRFQHHVVSAPAHVREP